MKLTAPLQAMVNRSNGNHTVIRNQGYPYASGDSSKVGKNRTNRYRDRRKSFIPCSKSSAILSLCIKKLDAVLLVVFVSIDFVASKEEKEFSEALLDTILPIIGLVFSLPMTILLLIIKNTMVVIK